MAEYIEREAALNSVCYDCSQNKNNLFCGIACADYERIKAIPASDVRPVVRGRWIDGKCNQCGEHAPFWPMATTYYKSKYCPNCGAKMGGEEE